MSMYCANRYAHIEAPTDTPVNPNTLVKSSEFTGDQVVAGTALAMDTTPKTKMLATNPAVTTAFARL